MEDEGRIVGRRSKVSASFLKGVDAKMIARGNYSLFAHCKRWPQAEEKARAGKIVVHSGCVGQGQLCVQEILLATR